MLFSARWETKDRMPYISHILNEVSPILIWDFIVFQVIFAFSSQTLHRNSSVYIRWKNRKASVPYQCNILHCLIWLKIRLGILLQMRNHLRFQEADPYNCEIIWPPNASTIKHIKSMCICMTVNTLPWNAKD